MPPDGLSEAILIYSYTREVYLKTKNPARLVLKHGRDFLGTSGRVWFPTDHVVVLEVAGEGPIVLLPGDARVAALLGAGAAKEIRDVCGPHLQGPVQRGAAVVHS